MVYIVILGRSSTSHGRASTAISTGENSKPTICQGKAQAPKFKDDLERTDATKANTSFSKLLDDCYVILFSKSQCTDGC